MSSIVKHGDNIYLRFKEHHKYASRETGQFVWRHSEVIFDDTVILTCASKSLADEIVSLMNTAYDIGAYEALAHKEMADVQYRQA